MGTPSPNAKRLVEANEEALREAIKVRGHYGVEGLMLCTLGPSLVGYCERPCRALPASTGTQPPDGTPRLSLHEPLLQCRECVAVTNVCLSGVMGVVVLVRQHLRVARSTAAGLHADFRDRPAVKLTIVPHLFTAKKHWSLSSLPPLGY